MPSSRPTRIAVLLGVAALLVTSCRDSTGPDAGTVMVSVSTTGTDIDPDGYVLTLGADAPRTMPVNASLTIEGVKAGAHSLSLSGLATNCSATPASPMNLDVRSGTGTAVAFQVVCVARVGTVIVTTTTSGHDLDGDGYLLGVETAPMKVIATTSVDTVRSVREGDRVLLLTGLATNCAVDGSATRTIGIVFNDTARVGFAVTCVARRGTIRVNTTTSGNDMDDAFLVQIDGGPGTSIGRSGTVEVPDLTEGVHAVTLSGVASNCTVLGSNPRSLTVVHGETASTVFIVTCVQRSGAVRVITATTGVELDPDGYKLFYQSYYTPTFERALVVNGSLLIGGLQLQNPYEFWIAGIARNCSVSGSSFRSLPVLTYGDTVNVTFSINCVQSGTLQVNVATSGVELDATGYVVRVTGPNLDTLAAVAINGTVTIPKLAPGDYVVGLEDVAANCVAAGSNPRTVAVGAPTVTVSSFAVQCAAPQDVAYVSTYYGHEEIYLVKSSGAGETRLTTGTGNSGQPDWSPDGSKIVFRSDRDGNEEIYVMNANGSNVVRLTNSAGGDNQPVWSPDGTRIAFTSGSSGNAEIYVMNSDGSNVIRLTDNTATDAEPSWAPDGTRIAFRTQRDGNSEIYIMNANGSSPIRLTFNELEDVQPAWSPDGAKIAFSRGVCDPSYYCGAQKIYMITVAGNQLTQLSTGFRDYNPSWSRDGSRIAYDSQSCDDYGCLTYVHIVRVEGKTTGVLTGPYAHDPAWRP